MAYRYLCNVYRAEFVGRREGINPAVNAEVGDIFKGKTTNQLRLLEQQIRDKLSGGEGIDVGRLLCLGWLFSILVVPLFFFKSTYKVL